MQISMPNLMILLRVYTIMVVAEAFFYLSGFVRYFFCLTKSEFYFHKNRANYRVLEKDSWWFSVLRTL
jgi:hypothetical protein